MFRPNLIFAIRHILRNRLQSVVQIVSLTIGMAVTIQLGLYIDHEFSTDKFHEHLDRIYRLEYDNDVTLPSAIGHEIKEQFAPEMNVVRMAGAGPRIKYISNKGKINEC